jgi:nucleotide-binding universal stress UspA family protein
VSHYLARHVPCPLIAVPAAGGPLAGGTIVAGVDAAPANEAALRWAADVARAVDGRLVALFVHSPMGDVMTHTAANWEYPGEHEVRAHVAAAGAAADVELVLGAGNPVEELIRLGAARDAGLIVVGRRGRGGLHGLLLGRVPAQLLHHAGRPVAVVPH